MSESRLIIVHRFRQADCDDPDLLVAEPLWEWQQSEQGKFVMDNARQPPVWQRYLDANTFGWQIVIKAELEGPALTEYLLRWGQ